MIPHHRLVHALLFCLLAAASPASGAKRVLGLEFPPGPPPPEEATRSAVGTCTLGIVGPVANNYGYILPPDDAYHTLLQPSQCGACSPAGYLLALAHFSVYFTEPCQIPVTISITPAVETAPGCYAPDPLAPPICTPVEYMISDGGNLNACQDVALPIAPGCCLTGPAFLTIEFDQGTCAVGRPRFCGPKACQSCTQYNFYPGAPAGGDDLCVLLGPNGLTGNIMFAESVCCSPTPVRAGSWGTLKTLYR